MIGDGSVILVLVGGFKHFEDNTPGIAMTSVCLIIAQVSRANTLCDSGMYGHI